MENKQSDISRDILSFNEYRETLDKAVHSLMRFGLETEVLYEEATLSDAAVFFDESSILKGIIAATTNDMIDAYIPDASDRQMVSIYPKVDAYPQDLKDKLVFREVVYLNEDTTRAIFQGTEDMDQLINQAVQANLAGRDMTLIGSEGVKNYMLFTKYDTSNCHQKYSLPPKDIETSSGHIITSNRQQILNHIEELIALQESVFEEQAATTGYYDGLRGQEVIELLNNSNFIPIAAINPSNKEVEMFALFSPNFDNLNNIPWLNPGVVDEHYNQQPKADVLVMPLIMTSKFSGLGFLRHVVNLALQEIVYSYRPNTMAVMYENNGMSVHYIPRVIEREITKNGAPSVYHHAEVYYYSEKA